MNSPVAAPGRSPAANRGGVPVPAQAGKGCILVVDDDRLVLLTLTNGLRQAGYDVVDADNGDEAILLAREHRPELALLDIRMEGLSGFDVAETLRDVYRIPFMFLSAFADAATHAKVRELGALDYLTKPVDVDRILPSVAAALLRVRSSALVEAGADGGHGLHGADIRVGPEAGASSAPRAVAEDHDSLPSDSASGVAEPVWLAMGILMHRHSLSRQAARHHLQRLAENSRISVASQAERLLAAIEELARTAP